MRFFRGRREAGRAQAPSGTAADLGGRILPFVASPSNLPPEAVTGAPEVLPGLVAAVAVLDGDQMNFVPRASMGALGGEEAAREQARENMRGLGAPQIQAVRASSEDPSSVYFAFVTEDVFCASRIAILPDLVRLLTDQPAPHGVLVAAPRWHLLLLHILRGPGTLTALQDMARVASAEAAAAPELGRVSPNVYYVAADQRTQQVSSVSRGGISLETRGLMEEALYGPGGVLYGPAG